LDLKSKVAEIASIRRQCELMYDGAVPQWLPCL